MIDLVEIKRLIPHRYPMLLVDQVAEVVAGQSLLAIKAVSGNEPWYADATGCDYPPALVLESWCQAAGILINLGRPGAELVTDRIPLFGSATKVRFLAPVTAGELLRHRVRLLRATSDGAVLEGESGTAAGQVLQVGRVVVALRPAMTINESGGRGEG